mmetsp:Transcript_19342/g.29279  ORF Transcript_19342/g.29279 Transcript_19342/m.29279 type:complete len:130 (-) Transcript_19342:343-732(-)|eukprot:CAMPEP_0194112450 /NCGR_PEP_ID=MMETSP0150-20130528/12329_1 /TAXON_ID=122233 /ORGANISM="Chaetoceros debilis, Strain MM31A-1" /LENGTH=129 /DNA_ID=CAMNT_0038802113 /DNA_START=102 /DNA_END=491 /DNA_ORIENTATION=+
MNRVITIPSDSSSVKSSKKNTRPTKQVNSINARKERLYAVSRTKKQEDGRKRREAIALKSKARNAVLTPEDFGTIPMSQADQMYRKGQKALHQKEIRIAKQLEKKFNEVIAMHEFKLAEGAFATSIYDK